MLTRNHVKKLEGTLKTRLYGIYTYYHAIANVPVTGKHSSATSNKGHFSDLTWAWL